MKHNAPLKRQAFILSNDNLDIELISEGTTSMSRKQVMDARLVLYDAINSLIDTTKEFDNSSVTSFKKTLMINLSDVHFGKWFVMRKVFGKNVHFGEQNVTDMVNQVFERAYAELDADPDGFDEVIVNLVGDLFEGDGNMFPTQSREIEYGIMDQMNGFQKVLLPHIKLLSRYMNEVIDKKNKSIGKVRIFSVPGNHGEIRGRYIVSASNYDTMFAKNLHSIIQVMQEYGDHMNVSISYPDVDEVDEFSYEVKGWKYGLRHEFPKNLSTPSGTARILSTNEAIAKCDVWLTGHFHMEGLVSVGKTTVIRIGSIPGYEGYARGLGLLWSPSQQSLIIVTPEEKIYNYIPCTLNKERINVTVTKSTVPSRSIKSRKSTSGTDTVGNRGSVKPKHKKN